MLKNVAHFITSNFIYNFKTEVLQVVNINEFTFISNNLLNYLNISMIN